VGERMERGEWSGEDATEGAERRWPPAA